MTSRAGESASTTSGATSGGSIARGPSALMCFGVGSGAPAPAPRSRATSGATMPSASPMTSTSISRKRAATRRPSRTDTSSSTTSASRAPEASSTRTRRRTVERRATGIELGRAHVGADDGERCLRRFRAAALEVELVTLEQLRRRAVGRRVDWRQLQRPALAARDAAAKHPSARAADPPCRSRRFRAGPLLAA